jgi:hypothetical protein
MTWKRTSFFIAGAGLCAATAWLWCSGIVPALPGWISRIKELTVVILLVVQSLTMWPRGFKEKNNKRLLIKPQTMRIGSLTLIGGAALLLSALFDGCNPQAASGATQRFCTVVKIDRPWNPVLRRWFQGLGGALLPCGTQMKRPASRSATLWVAGPSSLCCAAQTDAARLGRAELTVALSRRQNNERI